MLSERCKKCGYSAPTCGLTCDYIGITGQKRPCPPGDECTVFDPRKHRRQTSLPALSGKNGKRKLPAEPDLLEYIDALDTALGIFGEA